MKDNAIARAVGKTLSQPEKTLRLTVNSQEQEVVVAPDTPLLYVLRGELQLNGPRFGCGLAQCGACTVHLDGKPIRSCVTPVASAVGHKITTLEGLAATYNGPHAGASSNFIPCSRPGSTNRPRNVEVARMAGSCTRPTCSPRFTNRPRVRFGRR